MKRIFMLLSRALVPVVLLYAIDDPWVRGEDTQEPFYFNDLRGDDYIRANREAAEKHFSLWKTAIGNERDEEARLVRFYAWRAGQSGLISQVIADGKLNETEIQVPPASSTVSVEIVYEVPSDRGDFGDARPVWRRLTKSAFEVWTPHEGCLYNASGKCLATVHPARDNAQGREWFGAFLPDGSWITTELHERDDRVYIFNRKGRCTHEIKVETIRGPGKPDEYHTSIIPWARSTKSGDAWLMRIGSEEGDGEFLLEPDGTWRRLRKTQSMWSQCQPRQLGVRLLDGICNFVVESDDGAYTMTSEQASHGPGVGNPMYAIHGRQEASLGCLPSDGREFGFWPGSHASHVFTDKLTWFFDARQHCQGWIGGKRAGDATDRRSMLFRMPDARLATISPNLKVTQVQKFVRSDGVVLVPLDLHPDIGLGVFAQLPEGGSVIGNYDDMTRVTWIGLGRWPVETKKK